MNSNDFEIQNGILIKYRGKGGNVTIPDGVTSIGNSAFSRCESLVSVAIPDGVTSIGGSAFSWCKSLTSVTIPDSVTSIGNYAFSDCTSLTSVTMPDSVTSIGGLAFSWCKSLTSVIIPDSVTSIGNYAFSGCRSLTSVAIPDGVTSIGRQAFDGCSNLTSVSIPDSVKATGKESFPPNMKLRACTLAPMSADEEQIKMLLDAFGTRNLALPFLLDTLQTNAIFEKKLQSRVTNKTFRGEYIPQLIADGEAQAMRKLLSLVKKQDPEEIDRYIALTENNLEIRAMLLEYKNRLYPPETLEKMEEIQTEKDFGIREKTLADYKKIFSIKKQDDVYVITNYKGGLDTVYIPAAIRGISVQIAMSGCETVREVYLEEGFSQIGNKAFSECCNLRSITIPDSVTNIGVEAFCGCSRLAIVQFNGTKEAWQAIEKGDNWKYKVPAKTIVCTDGRLRRL